MSFKYGVLSLMTLFVVLFLTFKNYDIWTKPIEWVPEEEGIKKPEKKSETYPALIIGGQKEKALIKSYISISEKNIFSPERKDFPILTSFTEPTMPTMTRPQVILYGVILMGNYKSATIANPNRPLKEGEREIITLKLGEHIGEYKLAEVLPDRIKLESSGNTFEVLLYDSKIPKQRAYRKTGDKPAPVTSTISPSPASPPVSAVVSQPSPQPLQKNVEPSVTQVPTSETLTSPQTFPKPYVLRKRIPGRFNYSVPSVPTEPIEPSSPPELAVP